MPYPNRLVCEVLEEMRTCTKTGNYSYLPSLIEEVQTMVNRMEAGLSDKKDIRRYHDEKTKIYKELHSLRKELADEKGTTEKSRVVSRTLEDLLD